jgi:hypothetical protein
MPSGQDAIGSGSPGLVVQCTANSSWPPMSLMSVVPNVLHALKVAIVGYIACFPQPDDMLNHGKEALNSRGPWEMGDFSTNTGT